MSDELTSLHTAWTTIAFDLEDPAAAGRALSEDDHTREQLQLLGTAIHVSGEGIAILTPAVEAIGPRIAFVNDSLCATLGCSREELIGATPAAFRIVERQRAIYDALLAHVFDQKPFEAEVTAQRKDGDEIELVLQLVPVTDSAQLTHWVAFLRDVTDSKTQLTSLRHQALHDALTDLPNRALLYERLESALVKAREERSTVAFLLMDLDRFKEVNDTFGHHFGDVLLKQVALRVRNQAK